MEISPKFMFDLAGAPILAFWFLIVFLPKWHITERIYREKVPVFYLAIIYSVVVIYGLITQPEFFITLLDPDLKGVQQLLSSEIGATAGWIHFLCFDLLVGVILWRHSLNHGHSFLWVSPILVLTLFLAPLGWLLYAISSCALRKMN